MGKCTICDKEIEKPEGTFSCSVCTHFMCQECSNYIRQQIDQLENSIDVVRRSSIKI